MASQLKECILLGLLETSGSKNHRLNSTCQGWSEQDESCLSTMLAFSAGPPLLSTYVIWFCGLSRWKASRTLVAEARALEGQEEGERQMGRLWPSCTEPARRGHFPPCCGFSHSRSGGASVKGLGGIKPILPAKEYRSPSSCTRIESSTTAVTDLQHTLKGVQGGDQE